jgi:hypothetical protein
MQTQNRTLQTTTMLLWLAVTVVAVLGFVIFSTARLFQDVLELEMPDIFSPGAGWVYALAWIIATGAILAFGHGGWPRTIAIVLLTTYLVGMAMVALQFLITIWSPTWTLT